MTEPVVPAVPKARKAYTRLTDAQKTEAITLWKAGTVTLSELETKFGATIQTFQKLFQKVGAKKGEGRAQLEAKRAAVVEAALVLDPAVHARRVFDTKNETFRVLEMIRKLTVKQIVDASNAGKPLGAIQNDLKSLREAASIIKTVREESYAVLGIKIEGDGDDDLPDLTIKELTEEDVEDLQSTPMAGGLGDMPDLSPEASDDDLDGPGGIE